MRQAVDTRNSGPFRPQRKRSNAAKEKPYDCTSVLPRHPVGSLRPCPSVSVRVTLPSRQYDHLASRPIPIYRSGTFFQDFVLDKSCSGCIIYVEADGSPRPMIRHSAIRSPHDETFGQEHQQRRHLLGSGIATGQLAGSPNGRRRATSRGTRNPRDAR